MAATTISGGVSEIRTSAGKLPDDKNSFFGASFNSKESEFNSSEIFLEKELVGIYFSGNWCPPCKSFFPHLVEFYKEINYDRHQFEILFASADKSEEEYNEYFGRMPWKAFFYNDDRFNKFKNYFGITGIPRLVILTPEGLLVTKDGRKDIIEKGEEAWQHWLHLKELALEKQKNEPQPVTGAPSPVGPHLSHLGASQLTGGDSPAKRSPDKTPIHTQSLLHH